MISFIMIRIIHLFNWEKMNEQMRGECA
jgi:hypothetical protein